MSDNAPYLSDQEMALRRSPIQVSVTAGELLDRHVWTEACDMIGLNSWAINEGQMDSSDRVTLTLEQARELGLLEGSNT